MFQLELFHKKTKFKDCFTISQGRSKTIQEALVVKLSMGMIEGWGESPAITYYDVDVETMIKSINLKRKFIESYSFNSPDRFWHFLHHLFPNKNFIINALDMAYWDIFGKIQQMPLYRIFKTKWINLPENDFTIGIDSLNKMKKKIKKNPSPIYKIKLGFSEDMDFLKEICNYTKAKIRLDINGNWSLPEALEKVKICKQFNVEFIEQPLPKDAYKEMEILFKESEIPLIADESCVHEKDILKCVQTFHGINIKLTKCGGITNALKMIEIAKKENLKIMMGTMNESLIGSAAIQHFLPLLDYVDMDGLLLLKTDYKNQIFNEDNTIKEPILNGLGITYEN